MVLACPWTTAAMNKSGQILEIANSDINKTWLWIGYRGGDRSVRCLVEILEGQAKDMIDSRKL